MPVGQNGVTGSDVGVRLEKRQATQTDGLSYELILENGI